MEESAIAIILVIWFAIILVWIVLVMFFYALIFGVSISFLILMVLMLIDCAQRTFPKPDDKTIWILVIVFTGGIGAAIYYFTVKRPADKLTAAR